MIDVKVIRTALGLTQGELASLLGIHTITISRWERNVLAPTPHTEALLEAFSRSQKLVPDIGERAVLALRTSGVSAALYQLLRPSCEPLKIPTPAAGPSHP